MCPFVSLHVDLHLDVWQLVLGDFKWFVCHYFFLEGLASERRQSLRGSRDKIAAGVVVRVATGLWLGSRVGANPNARRARSPWPYPHWSLHIQ